VWLARGKVPDWLGLWWVHIVVIALALIYIYGPAAIARLRYRELPRTAQSVPA